MSASIAAQDELVQEERAPRRYTVEIIIFSYAEDVSVGTERFFPARPVIDLDSPLTDDSAPNSDNTDAPAARNRAVPVLRQIELVRLPKDDYTMTDIISQLERLDAYETIMHIGWTQITYPQEETPAIQLHAFGDPPPGLDGSFTLYLSRYLHLVVDLALDAPDSSYAPGAIDERIISFGDSRLQNEADYDLSSNVIRYRIQENRILKSGELRYFDHPKFGVIARVTRVEEEKDNEDETLGEFAELPGAIGQ